MRLRAVHFACVLLLITTFGAADASVLQSGQAGLHGQYVGMLLQQGATAVASGPAFARGAAGASHTALPVASVAQTRTVWAMRPPSAHTVDTHTVTGFGR